MHSEIARAGFLIGALLLVGGIPLLFFVEPGTGEHVITLITVLIGVVFVVALGIAVRLSQR
jgi:hypothetical protein